MFNKVSETYSHILSTCAVMFIQDTISVQDKYYLIGDVSKILIVMPFGYTDKTFNTYSCVYNNNIIMLLRVIIRSFLFIICIPFVFNVYYYFMTCDKNVCNILIFTIKIRRL